MRCFLVITRLYSRNDDIIIREFNFKHDTNRLLYRCNEESGQMYLPPQPLACWRSVVHVHIPEVQDT